MTGLLNVDLIYIYMKVLHIYLSEITRLQRLAYLRQAGIYMSKILRI